jgi:hypothetical protein
VLKLSLVNWGHISYIPVDLAQRNTDIEIILLALPMDAHKPFRHVESRGETVESG